MAEGAMHSFFSYFSWFQIVLLMVGLMSGIFSLFREVVLINHPEKAKDGHLFWRCVFITFIVSSVWLWISEHQQTLALQEKMDQLTLPQLTGTMAEDLTRTGDKGQDTIVVIAGSIKNKGAPTVLDKWGVDVKFPDGRIVHGKTIQSPLPNDTVTIDNMNDNGHGSVILQGSCWWPAVTRSQPIATGSAGTGWMAAIFRDLDWQEIVNKDAHIVVRYSDINEKEWTTEDQLQPKSPELINLKDLPGVTLKDKP